MKRLLMVIFFVLLIQSDIFAAEKTLITISANNEDVKSVIRSIAEKAMINISIDEDIQKKVTLSLNDVSYEDALAALSVTSNFSISKHGNLFIVKAKELQHYNINEPQASYIFETNGKETSLIESMLRAISSKLNITIFPSCIVVTGSSSEISNVRSTMSEWLSRSQLLETNTVSQVVKLENISVTDLSMSIMSLYPNVRTSFIEALNSVIVTGEADAVIDVCKFIETLDIKSKRISIEVQFIEANQTDLSDLGISIADGSGSPNILVGWKEKDPKTQIYGDYVDTTKPQAEYSLRPFVRSSVNLVTEINALVKNGKANILARPSITTMENKTAKIRTGERYTLVLYVTQGTQTYQQQTYIDSGLSLEIIPRTNSDGEIIAQVSPEVSAVSGFTRDGYPIISTRCITTTVRVKDGETLVLGGLMQKQEYKQKSGLPYISIIPVIGNLFGASKTSSNTSELIVIIKLSEIK